MDRVARALGRDWTSEEFKEYIEAFRTSSDRARYALYVVIVATVLIGVANHNLQEGSWALQRLATWYSYDRPSDSSLSPAGPATDGQAASEEAPPPFFGGDFDQLEIAREEYLRQLVSSALLTQSPIPGVWVDFNDLGLVGGLALSFLMLVLVVCIVREHENLHLALFKVRCLCDSEPNHGDGDSAANLLYHGLAMRQVLSAPPTLARWRSRRVLGLLWAFFFLPPAVYVWVVWTNWQTMEHGANYGVDVRRTMILQFALVLIIAALSIVAFLHSRSMTHRWRRAFFRVNPGRRHAPQMTLWEWLKLKPKRHRLRGSEKRLVARLVDTLKVGHDETPDKVEVKITRPLEREVVSQADRDGMAQGLLDQGKTKAAEACAAQGRTLGRLLHFEPDENFIVADGDDKASWTVAGSWTYAQGVPVATACEGATRPSGGTEGTP